VIATVLPVASLVAELARPVNAPTNVVAVTTPETLALPSTSNFAVGLFVPIPNCA
jgi:hypothetical protein